MNYDLPIPEKAALARSQALIQWLHTEINAANGVISFAAFMEAALYHPQYGYYTAPAIKIGAMGDFTTAPEISSLFAACFAKQCESLLSQLTKRHILEWGAGSGRFACDLLMALASADTLPDAYYIIEKSPALREQQKTLIAAAIPQLQSRVHWLDDMPPHFIGIVLANEVLDALPVTCFCIEDNKIMEKGVTWENDSLAWKQCSPSAELQSALTPVLADIRLPDNYHSEINLSLEPFLQSLVTSMQEGVILLIDYGYGQKEYYHPARKAGTLTCFYKHHQTDNPFIYPGLQDITAHVDFTRVIEIAANEGAMLAGFTTQTSFLINCGLSNLVIAKESTLDEVAKVNLHHAIKTLTMPTEMGEVVKVMGITVNVEEDLIGFQALDRSRDL